ncbi:uncharacterized protein V6R79_005011 [Siganus canaliculatus]
MGSDAEQQEDELLALHSIFGSDEFVRNEPKAAGEIRICVELPADFSVSLREGETLRQYELSSLPPLLLTFELSEHYPSSSPPTFTLTCSWLSHTQISALCAQLAELYQDAGGAVVLFTWIQFLKEEALSFLDIHTELELPSENWQDSKQASQPSEGERSCEISEAAAAGGSAPRPAAQSSGEEDSGPAAGSEQGASSELISPREPPENQERTLSGLSLTPSQTLLSQLLLHDAAQKQKQFSSTVFDCGVCFMSFLGSECVEVVECGHIFCRACLAQFCKLQITEGNVRGVTCLQADCTAAPSPAQVKLLVGDELFSRYDRLLLQSSLDAMSDVVYCPRLFCGSAVIKEKSSPAAVCSSCSFAFCVLCRKTYHGTDSCQVHKKVLKQTKAVGEEANADLPQSLEGMRALWDDYACGSKQRKRLLENRYGLNSLRLTMEGFLSEDWITTNSKNCPHCFRRIEKNGGCNLMTCSRCRQIFCWICLTRLTSSTRQSHFWDSSCPLSGQQSL